MDDIVFFYKNDKVVHGIKTEKSKKSNAQDKKITELEKLVCKMLKKMIGKNYSKFSEHSKIRKPLLPFRLAGKLGKNVKKSQALIYQT